MSTKYIVKPSKSERKAIVGARRASKQMQNVETQKYLGALKRPVRG